MEYCLFLDSLSKTSDFDLFFEMFDSPSQTFLLERTFLILLGDDLNFMRSFFFFFFACVFWMRHMVLCDCSMMWKIYLHTEIGSETLYVCILLSANHGLYFCCVYANTYIYTYLYILYVSMYISIHVIVYMNVYMKASKNRM